ncbi:hypothetical protein [Planctomyces sp. SH-PL62]|uniref:hypothetical protein n=1 Tax=Planctomyces sp. SH-PL62 TaxID=1636152 RepID=UPI00078D945D|nr:hypothetical protein [Planctomyces sp. SH-PL62]AMV39530.1 hypothetical protein VT85_18990 [Planctomyces sp. SH-PL62]
MIGNRSSPPYPRLAAVALGLVAVALAGAGTLALEANRARFLMISPLDRQELREALRRFDLRLNDDEQRAVRALDERLNAMPEAERDEYLVVLRRYHNWLHQLPERVRDDLLAVPVAGRMARIRELSAKYPPPDGEARSPLDFVQIGGTGPFELAALVKAWFALSPADRKQVDSLPAGDRKSELIRRGRELKIPRELKPDDFDEARWMSEVETRIKELRGPAGGPRDWIARIEGKFDQAGPLAAEGNPRPRPFLRRLAANLYVQEHAPEHPVDPTRLAAFFTATPPWIQSTFSAFPSDEVRRRLSVIYRIVFPFPEEYRATAPTPAPKPLPTVTEPAAAPPKAAPAPRPSTGATPF